MRSVSVHPASTPGSRSSDAASAPTIHYRLVPCRPLPAFDPVMSIKRLLFPAAIVNAYNVCFTRTRGVLIVLYVVGVLLRTASNFLPTAATDVMSMVTAACLTPLCFVSFLDMRRGMVAVLLRSFDFWFLGVTSSVWTIALGAAMWPSVRLVTLPALWMEVTIGSLTESYLTVRAGFTAISTNVLLSILTLMTAASLDLTPGLDYGKQIFLIAPTNRALSLRDVVLNTMATTGIFYARLILLSIRDIHRHRHNSTNTRVHSVLVRCPLQWEAVTKGGDQQPRCASNEDIRYPAPPTAAMVAGSAAATSSSHQTRLLQMTPVADPHFDTLDVSDTVSRKAPALTRRLHRVLPPCLVALGLIGVVTTAVGLAAEFEAPSEAIHPAPALAIVIDVVSAIAFASTTIYSAVVFACYQRKLLRHTVATFNFLFLSLQISVAHFCIGDLFYWQWHKALSVIASWMWMHVLLTADSLSPVMKRRLGLKTWYMLPIVMLSIAGQAALSIELLWGNRWKLQSRVVWAVQMSDGWRMEMSSASVLLGRLATLVVWFLRLMVRIWRRNSDSELIFVQGDVEFDYIAWKQRVGPPPKSRRGC